MSNGRRRRLIGLGLGTLVGLIYGAVAQGITRAYLPGIPLYQPPFGPVGNAALCLLIAAALGVFTAWPAGSVGGILLGSTLAGLGVVLNSLLNAPLRAELIWPLVLTGVFLVLPFVALLAPALALFRWAVNVQEESVRERYTLGVRLRGPLLLVLAAVAIGWLALLRPDARLTLARMDALVQDGQRSAGAAGLPAPLAGADVADFAQHAGAAYQLEWTKSDLNRYRIPRPAQNFDAHTIAVARFADGWMLACLFVAPDVEPTCRGY